MSTKRFEDKLNKRRQEVVLFISTLLWIIGTAGLVLSFVNFVAPTRTESQTIERLSSFVGAIIAFAVLTFIRFVLARHKYTWALLVIVFLQTIISVFLMLRNGTTSVIPFVMVTAAVLCLSIVINVKVATGYVIGYIVAILVVFCLHRVASVPYSPGDTSSSPFTTIYLIIFLLLDVAITNLAYGEIANSYKEAAQHAADLAQANKGLAELNEDLEDKVKIRTQQLEESFRQQLETFYENAVLGTISKAMVHDIATPLSTISGTLQLLQEDKAVSKYADLINITNLSLHQIEDIIENSRDLMRGELPGKAFDPDKSILSAVRLVQNRLHMNEIKLQTELSAVAIIYGPETIFERIILNILSNAIEELSETHKDRLIVIKSWVESGKYFMSIRDSGRGIQPEDIDKIFLPNFSHKEANHLGFGLAFVKETWERHFNGQVNLRSEVGEYTQFVLSTQLYDSESKTTK